MKKSGVDIILPNRIGDAVMTLPVIVCLKQLIESGDKSFKVKLLCIPALIKLFKALNLFDVEELNPYAKVKSWLNPADKAFFLETTSKNLGYHAKKTYGLSNPSKKLIKYSAETSYLHFDQTEEVLSKELSDFLRTQYDLSWCSIRYFGVCLDLGFSVEEIQKIFNFSPDFLSFNEEFYNYSPVFLKGSYLVFCMEAAYGKKGDSDRRWDDKYYFELAEKAYNHFNIDSVFVGIDNKNSIPDRPYFKDLRKKLDILELAQLLYRSKCYIGNDTGPLHIANLVKIPSIGIYFRANSLVDYSPIFPQFNIKIFNPGKSDDIFEVLEQMVK